MNLINIVSNYFKIKSSENLENKNFLNKKSEIISWLNKQGIEKFSLAQNSKYSFVVNVKGSVDLSSKNLEIIPVKFNSVHGDFDCSDNKLTSLDFAPNFVEKSFYCNNNSLKTLKGCPANILREMDCSFNELLSLEHCCEELESFNCSHNKLTNLLFGPQKIKKNLLNFSTVVTKNNFDCSYNKLISLEGSPKKILGEFDCSYNNLTSLKGSPEEIEKSFMCSFNKLFSLEFCPKSVNWLICSHNQLNTLEFLPENVNDNYFDCSNNLQLGDIQNINKFNLIFQEQLKILQKLQDVTDFKDKLENNLSLKKSEKILKI